MEKGSSKESFENFLKAASLLYQLNQTEISCFSEILKRTSKGKETTRNELTKKLKKDASTVTRALKKLEAIGIIFKEKRCCTHGKRGRYFVYFSMSMEELAKKLRADAEIKYRAVMKLIDQDF